LGIQTETEKYNFRLSFSNDESVHAEQILKGSPQYRPFERRLAGIHLMKLWIFHQRHNQGQLKISKMLNN
jgi:hypothetical protein